MSTKTKTKKTSVSLSEAAKQAGYLLMATAATIGMLETPDHNDKRLVLPTRPSFAFAENNLESELNNPIRREREEVAPHYISYSVVQRTASRSGSK